MTDQTTAGDEPEVYCVSCGAVFGSPAERDQLCTDGTCPECDRPAGRSEMHVERTAEQIAQMLATPAGGKASSDTEQAAAAELEDAWGESAGTSGPAEVPLSAIVRSGQGTLETAIGSKMAGDLIPGSKPAGKSYSGSGSGSYSGGYNSGTSISQGRLFDGGGNYRPGGYTEPRYDPLDDDANYDADGFYIGPGSTLDHWRGTGSSRNAGGRDPNDQRTHQPDRWWDKIPKGPFALPGKGKKGKGKNASGPTGPAAPAPGTRAAQTGPNDGTFSNVPDFLARSKGELSKGVLGLRDDQKKLVGAVMTPEMFAKAIRHMLTSMQRAADDWHVLVPQSVWVDLEEQIADDFASFGKYWTHSGNVPLTVEDYTAPGWQPGAADKAAEPEPAVEPAAEPEAASDAEAEVEKAAKEAGRAAEVAAELVVDDNVAGEDGDDG